MDLDEEELKATRKLNGSDKNVGSMEEDIKIVEEILIANKKFGKYLSDRKLIAIEHLIKAYKELEKEIQFQKEINKTEQDRHKQTEKSLKGQLEKKDKIIDLMAEYMEEEFSEYQLDNIYAELYNCNGMERNWIRGKEAEIKDIKKYFERKVENEN